MNDALVEPTLPTRSPKITKAMPVPTTPTTTVATSGPHENELAGSAVFQRWEQINQQPDQYDVQGYEPLEPLYFNFHFGADLFVRYRELAFIKLEYAYSNPMGSSR